MKTTMSVSRALKEKSRILTKLSEARDMVHKYNAVDLGTRRPIAVKEAIERAAQLEENLIRIKVAIEEANLPINRQLIEMMAVRAELAFYAGLDTDEVRTVTRRDEEEVKVTRDVSVGQTEVLKKIEELKEKIDRLQDEVDEFNAVHKVEVELV